MFASTRKPSTRHVVAALSLAIFAACAAGTPATAATPGVDAVIPVPRGWHRVPFPAKKTFLGGRIVDAYQSPAAPNEAIFIVASTFANVAKTPRGAAADDTPIDDKTTLASLIESSTTGAHRIFVTDDELCNGRSRGALARYSLSLQGGTLPATLLVKAAASGPYFVQVAYLRPSSHPTDSDAGAALHDECLPSPSMLRTLYGHR